MRFALLGDHADGLDMARALVESGRHELAAYSGPPVGAEYLRRWDLKPNPVGDLEEILADPTIPTVIIASGPALRMPQLRRALQSERHVLCVHPLDPKPDGAYEAAMLQADTRQILFPLLTEAFHPGILRLAKHIRAGYESQIQVEKPIQTAVTVSPNFHPGNRIQTSFLRLIEMERWATDQVLLDADLPEKQPGLPGWEVLRLLGGEILEVTALTLTEEIEPGQPLVVAGLFDQGGMFQSTLIPNQPEPRWRLVVTTRQGRFELDFPQGWPGPACLSSLDGSGGESVETWEAWNPWPPLVAAFEAAVAKQRPSENIRAHQPLDSGGTSAPLEPLARGEADPGQLYFNQFYPSWQDEVRCLELDEATRRSVERRRVSIMDFQDVSEETGFKGTMTLVGCSLIWLTLVLLILSIWLPWITWVIIPLFGTFLLLQLLRWVVPEKAAEEEGKKSVRPR